MTMGEDKETEVRSTCPPSSSDYATIVPIKKRRYLIYRPPSPPPEEPCPIPEPKEKQQEGTSVSAGSAISNITPEEGKPESSAISQGAGVISASRQSEDAPVNQDKLERLSGQLESTNVESSLGHSFGAMRSESDVTDLCTNRSNWDLNTTMDAWEGSAGDAAAVSTDHLRGTIIASVDHVDLRPLGSSSVMPGVNVLREQTAAEHQRNELGAAPSAPCINPQTHEDSLKLGLQIPLPSNFSREPPYLSPGIDPNTIFSRVSSAGSTSIIPPMAVKSEPYGEAQGQASLGTGSGDLKCLVGKAGKRETVDKGGLEVSSSTLKSFDSRSVSVKAEPAYEAAPVTLRTREETSKGLEQISQGMVLESCSKIMEPLPVNCPVVNESQTIGNHLKDGFPDKEDNDYEDGEVKDQLAAVGPTNATPVGNVSRAEGAPENVEVAGNPSHQCADSPLQKKDDNEMQICSEMEETLLDCADSPLQKKDDNEMQICNEMEETLLDCADSPLQKKDDNEMQICSEMEESLLDEKSQMSFGLDANLQELSDVEVDSDTKVPAIVAQGAILLPANENPVTQPDIANISGEATISNHELSGAFAQDDNAVNTKNIVSDDDAGKSGSILPKTESFIDSDVVGRDSSTEGNRSHIINSSATFNMSSPGKTSSASDRSMPLHDGRKRLPNVVLEGDKLHLQGRDEVGNVDFHRFSKERSRDMFSRNSRSGFARDRGRIPSKMYDGWEYGQDFNSEMRKGSLEFRATRYRYNSEYRNYNVSPEDGFVGTGRGGHRFLADNSPNFHSPQSMRRAHGGRDGPATCGPPTGGRVPQNMSPSRCIGMDDSEFVRVRYGFAQRERDMGSCSTKSFPHMHSKSPVRLRSRSPIQWSSPRRRSPDGFVRHPGMVARRSPPMYRRERMRSPDRACFHGEAMMRRQNSPPYISRQLDDMRDMTTGRDHGFSRPIMHNRNLSTRFTLRTRRYDTVNSRERTHGEYFRVPLRGARFHEISGEENLDERRRLNERRGPVRHFRPACVSSDEGFTYGSENGCLSYRLCPEDDSVCHEGGNSRERQLERHPKSELGDAHKTRKIEDQEGSFGDGVTDEFDDMPRYKRERV